MKNKVWVYNHVAEVPQEVSVTNPQDVKIIVELMEEYYGVWLPMAKLVLYNPGYAGPMTKYVPSYVIGERKTDPPKIESGPADPPAATPAPPPAGARPARPARGKYESKYAYRKRTGER